MLVYIFHLHTIIVNKLLVFDNCSVVKVSISRTLELRDHLLFINIITKSSDLEKFQLGF